ncbi:F4 (K88) fimbria accessory protein FaeJ [Escherichia coli]|uniref:F4 (K88) fimbria accessory protein FaeJ n=1 Tax=Escherichia coli TaxID=562 RepID=UPI000D163701|nr:F4 (K88) fimbria accessory protein FaeJ [Escherichia coli]MBB9725934.1 F4 (K88) fimbria accessory protein FaeJ [Escherichia coli]PSY47350.1 fimbrial protein [Escherichia coli]
MLNIIHCLKSGMFPALFFLTSASALAQPRIISPGHWQEGMAVGVTEFSGTLYVPEVSWQWQPNSVRMSTPDAVQAGLATGKDGMVSKGWAGRDFYILGGHTTSLTTSRPGLQPSVTLLQVVPSSPRIAVRGELARGQVRYGEITFTVRHLLAWQNNITASQGWSVVSGEVTPEAERQVKRQLCQVNGYEWTPDYSGLTVRPDAFISGTESLSPQENDRQHIAGAWVTFLSDVRVNFPGAEEAVKRWQANLTPVVMYF